jgi:hypothetical protein
LAVDIENLLYAVFEEGELFWMVKLEIGDEEFTEGVGIMGTLESYKS